ncbi:MAG: class I SAM-dependent methyltransferase [Clostridiales bacterium]|jgi:23S rRNA (cytosine1962-C5)-methyltransferase|nr:class I SAM-dependent methyltransferase [Clostridiales bacterium]
MRISDKWREYELIDATCGRRLERWGSEIFIRPDPTAVWDLPQADPRWEAAAAVYTRSDKGGGEWSFNKKLPEKWAVSYGDLKFWVKPMGFKHMGIFPEQAVNWEFIAERIKGSGRKKVRVLNLFAYTGGATIAASLAGRTDLSDGDAMPQGEVFPQVEVCHVDASRGIVQMAKENAALNGAGSRPIRYIVDDCAKFVAREIRRNSLYDAIILDPPSYGRGPNGEIWKIEDELCKLLELCKQTLTESPLFMLLNSYTTGMSAGTLKAIMELIMNKNCEADELALPVTARKIAIPAGNSVRLCF